jgi:hypothetical protein
VLIALDHSLDARLPDRPPDQVLLKHLRAFGTHGSARFCGAAVPSRGRSDRGCTVLRAQTHLALEQAGERRNSVPLVPEFPKKGQRVAGNRGSEPSGRLHAWRT